ncbi:hypothetical protein [Streptomyces avicenniae]|uniref:hypothetical protein n=1 Tax=Streptomyces avicenniae TaxID=500153 RepID=UPI000B1F7C09|nr:hypothetical protein [Streptomyces avicenniae]
MAEDETPGTKDEEEPAAGPAGRRRWSVAIAAAVAGAVIAGGVWGAAALRGDDEGDGASGAAADGSSASEVLALDAAGGTTEAGAAEPAGGIAPAGVELTAEGTLPDGPDLASVQRFDGGVDEGTAAGLAAALGVEGEVRENAGAWTASGPDADGGVLTVQQAAPGGWSYGTSVVAADPDTPVEQDAAAQVPAGDVPGEDEALDAAGPLLAELGLAGGDDAVVDASATAGGVRLVRVVPLVDGLPVSGMETTVHVATGGAVVAAYGSLAEPVAAEERAAIGAQEALEEWNAALTAGGPADLPSIEPCFPVETLPVPEGGTQAEPDGGAADAPDILPCAVDPAPAAAEPLAVTAEFGLALRYSADEPVLVPSWLFRPADAAPGDPYPVQQPAVAYAYVPSDGSGGGSGDDGGSDTPPQQAPAEPGDGTQLPDTGMSVAPYEEDDRALTLTFWGSPCDEYTGAADESADAVFVSPVAEERPEETACIMLAEERTVEVALDAPVGGRPVLAEDGSELPVR